jgi:hypothetical protein
MGARVPSGESVQEDRHAGDGEGDEEEEEDDEEGGFGGGTLFVSETCPSGRESGRKNPKGSREEQAEAEDEGDAKHAEDEEIEEEEREKAVEEEREKAEDADESVGMEMLRPDEEEEWDTTGRAGVGPLSR